MEALTFMKLWLTNTTVNKPRRETRISESLEDDLCEGDDSFFELEISLSDFSLHKNKTPQEKQNTFSLSKSKVIPFVEPTSPTTTPLNSGRKFHAFSFKKKENNTSLNVSFRKTTTIAKSLLKPDTMFSVSSVSSVSPVSPVSPVSSVSSVSSSKRFFDLIKPLYNKTTKKQSVNSVSTSPASSPATAREKQKPSGFRRQLGKSRSASAALSPAKRVDESLQVQQDGIQSAILHCKKSFHGSEESCMLSRSTSESYSQEKLSTSSSEDSYLFSRLSSDSMSEKSFDSLTSIKEQGEKTSD